MTLDELLSQPLARVRDDGFSARVALAALRRRQRRQTLLLCAGLAALLPPLAMLPLAESGDVLAASLAGAPLQPYLSLLAAGLILLWALRPRPFRL